MRSLKGFVWRGVGRELEKSPTLLIAALPSSPAGYAALPGIMPRPRTNKMVRARMPAMGCTYRRSPTQS